jgi:hypothetical protein
VFLPERLYFGLVMGFEQMEGNEIGERLDIVHRSRQMLTVHFRSRTKSKDIVKNGGEESWGSPIGAMNTLGENCEERDGKRREFRGAFGTFPVPSRAMGWDD